VGLQKANVMSADDPGVEECHRHATAGAETIYIILPNSSTIKSPGPAIVGLNEHDGSKSQPSGFQEEVLLQPSGFQEEVLPQPSGSQEEVLPQPSGPQEGLNPRLLLSVVVETFSVVQS
jgi:hypothetical protein